MTVEPAPYNPATLSRIRTLAATLHEGAIAQALGWDLPRLRRVAGHHDVRLVPSPDEFEVPTPAIAETREPLTNAEQRRRKQAAAAARDQDRNRAREERRRDLSEFTAPPPAAPAERRRAKVMVCFTATELERISRAAAESGLKTSRYIADQAARSAAEATGVFPS